MARDHQTVKIYTSYPIIGSKTVIHREMIESIDLEAREGNHRWTGNGITMIIYEHSRGCLEMIHSVLCRWSPAGAFSQSSGLSQLEGHYLFEDDNSVCTCWMNNPAGHPAGLCKEGDPSAR